MFKCLIINIYETTVGRSLGPYRIAHHLRENGWDAEVIDYIFFWELEELKEMAKSRINSDTVFIGFSQMFSLPLKPTVVAFIEWLRKTYPNILLILGSPSVTVAPVNMFDVHIRGFGELALLEFLKWHVGNGTMPKIEMIPDKKSDNSFYKLIDANKNYPAFPLKSLMVKYEDRDFLHPLEWLGMEFARGCKFKCDFCNFPILGVKGDYSRDQDDFYEQMMDTYDRYGIKKYIVSDETFNDRTEKITKFADVVEKLPFVPWFSGFIRADLLINRPLDRIELSRMNFLGHFYGIETFNKEAGKAVKKGMDPDKLKQGLIDIRNYFENNGRKLYRGTLSLIIGLPGESISSLDDTKKWLLTNWKEHAFHAYPLEIYMGEMDTPSLISQNYEKYGYRKMNDDSHEKLIDQDRKKNSNMIQNGNDSLMWESAEMNCHQARDIAINFWKIYHHPDNQFGIDNFKMARYDYLGEVEELLHRPIGQTHGYKDAMPPNLLNFVRTYVHKKLSL